MGLRHRSHGPGTLTPEDTIDYSTINREELLELPVYKMLPTYRLQDGSGNGCYGDPPGYPTYFTRDVYTQHGNAPSRGPQYVIGVRGDDGGWRAVDNKGSDEDQKAKLRRLWLPLPIDHPRTRMWIQGTYQHMANCYSDVERLEYGKPGTLIYPVPDYNLKRFTDDYRWSDHYRAAAVQEVNAYNVQERERARRIAIPENHHAVRTIREFYPEYEPEIELIEAPPQERIPAWWETEAEQPSAAQCQSAMRWGTHPLGDPCQFCGWPSQGSGGDS